MLKLGAATQVRDLIARYLEAEDVRYVFGIPGSYILGLYDAIGASPASPRTSRARP